MTRYRIVRVSQRTWKVQSKWLFWWLDEGVGNAVGGVNSHRFSTEREAEGYIDRKLADHAAAKERPREYPITP